MNTKRIKASGALGALLCALAASLTLAGPASATSDTVTAATSTTTTTVTAGTATTLAGMSVTGTGSVLVTVATTSGALHVNTSTGVSLASGYSNDASELTFRGTVAQVNSALDALTLTASGADKGGSATVTITARPDGTVVYSPTNEHFYEYVEDSGITWEAAKTAAQSKTYGGQTGYLATVPNSSVNALITSKIPGAQNVWLGGKATNESTTRVWRWIDGPLAGTAFSNCSTTYGEACNFSPALSTYNNWSEGEPNNWDDDSDDWLDIYEGESYIVTNWGSANGLWNDLKNSPNETIYGYVVEYGDLPIGDSDGFTGVYSATATVAVNGVPNAPTGVTATAGEQQVSVGFTAPANDGGPDIDGYRVTTSPGGATTDCASSPCVVTGLTAGTAYTFTVKAHNSVGYSVASGSAGATPGVTPGSPSGGPSSLVVGQSYSASVTATGYPTPTYAVTAGALPAGLTLGSNGSLSGTPTATGNWSFQVTASNTYGSASTTYSGSTGSVPDITATGLGSLTWGVAIDRTLASTGVPDGTWQVLSGSLPAGLTLDSDGRLHGTPTAAGAYSVTLKITNTHGNDTLAASGSVAAVAPDAPTVTGVTPGDGTLSVAFTAPTFTGGGALTTYQYSLNGGATWNTRTDSETTASPLVVSGLTNGSSYTVVIRAVNADAESTGASAGPAVPRTTASAPAITTIEAGNHSLKVAFTAPTNTGGVPVSGYQYSLDGGATWDDATLMIGATSLTIYGLTNGATYDVALRAVTSAGSGAASTTQPATPAVEPVPAPDGDALPELLPGHGETQINGEDVTTGVTTSGRSYVVTAGSASLTLTALDPSAHSVPLDRTVGSFVTYTNGFVQVEGSGFLPGSTVDVWLFSEPRLLGTALVGADGKFTAKVALPAGVPVGIHTIQANGLTAASESISAQLGLRVSAKVPSRLASTGASISPLPAALALVAIGVPMVAYSRRRAH